MICVNNAVCSEFVKEKEKKRKREKKRKKKSMAKMRHSDKNLSAAFLCIAAENL